MKAIARGTQQRNFINYPQSLKKTQGRLTTILGSKYDKDLRKV
jgi:hypothetical protein